ncbi:MAG: response regulator [Deltaproteobacteria bacterium]|nr:response regulator [Deltaproteobacteria bacterium]
MVANGQKKVLVVEDDSVIRDLLIEVLNAAGYETDMAEDGAAGLDKIKKHVYDLIISDIYMPVLGGISMYINAVWENAGLRERFLFITGNTSDDAKAIITQMDIKYLMKPFKIVDILGCVESIIERAELLDKYKTGKRHNGKRTDARFSLQKECAIFNDNGENTSAAPRVVKTSDLSRNGLRVVYEGPPFAPQTPLSVLIKLNSLSLRRAARVVWSNIIDEVYSVSGLTLMKAVPVQSLSAAFHAQ